MVPFGTKETEGFYSPEEASKRLDYVAGLYIRRARDVTKKMPEGENMSLLEIVSGSVNEIVTDEEATIYAPGIFTRKEKDESQEERYVLAADGTVYPLSGDGVDLKIGDSLPTKNGRTYKSGVRSVKIITFFDNPQNVAILDALVKRFNETKPLAVDNK